MASLTTYFVQHAESPIAETKQHNRQNTELRETIKICIEIIAL